MHRRAHRAPPARLAPGVNFTNDGVCDDGNLAAATDYCSAGTDCTDCGVLIMNQDGAYWAKRVFAILVTLVLVMYLLDFSYWTSSTGKFMKKVGAGTTVLLLFAASILVAKDYPPMPMALFILGMPTYFVLIRRTVFAHNSISAFFFCVSASTGLGCVLSLCIWIAWIMSPPGYAWNATTKRFFNNLMYCTNNIDDPDAPICLEAFMLWISPLINAGFCFGLAVVTGLLARTTQGATRRSGVMIKIVSLTILISMFGMYVAASVAGSSMGLSNSIMPFCGAAIALVIVSTASSMGLDNMKQSVMSIPLMKRMRSSLTSPFFQGFLVMMGFPFMCVFFLLSFFNQLVRKLGLPCSKKMDDEERSHYLTAAAMHQLEMMRQWTAADVMAKVLIWVVAGWCLVVGGNKVTYIALSFLIKLCKTLPHWGVVVAVFVPVGLIMFLLPPVPGTPVYLCGGVLLVPLCEEAFGKEFDPEGCAEPMPRAGCAAGFWLAMLFATLLCFVMKLIAIVMQQKGIGERLGQHTAIRAAVDINSTFVKAMRLILSQPGMSPGKVMILCGGPDWPTSVFTGILGLNVFSMLYGSLPVVIIVGTSAMAGAFQYAKTKGGAYESLANVALVVGLLAQLIFFSAALYYIEDVVQNKADKIKAYPDDEDVKKLDVKILAKAQARKAEIVWAKVPKWLRFLLISGNLVGLLSGWYVLLFMGDCFSEFEITMDPDTVLCMSGTPENPAGWGDPPKCTSPIVKTNGWAMSGCFVYVVFCLVVWRKWAAKRTKEAVDRGDIPAAEDVEHPEEGGNDGLASGLHAGVGLGF